MRSTFSIGIAILFFLFVQITTAAGQQKQGIAGILKGKHSDAAVSFATVALYSLPDSTLISGTASDAAGRFFISSTAAEKSHFIRITHVGYKTLTREVSPQRNSEQNLGIISLEENSNTISEVVVSGTKLAAKVDGNKVSYTLNKTIYQTAQTGVDALKNIPGIQVDFMQNITLEGNRNIAIYVDGKERDIAYIRQLPTKSIEKIEVQSTPDAKYGTENSGVINIILKEPVTGISGDIHAEIPTNRSEVYIFPSYSFSLTHKKISFFTSYNGDIKRLKLEDNHSHSVAEGDIQATLNQNQHVMQRDQVHRFSYGVDYNANKKNLFSFYGYVTSFSQKFDGDVSVSTSEDRVHNSDWTATKNDSYTNHQILSSLYYQHKYEKGGEVAIDLSLFHLKTESSSFFHSDNASDIDLKNVETSSKPTQNTAAFKLDYSHPASHNLILYAGIRSSNRKMDDHLNNAFRYNEYSQAAYGKIDYNGSKLFVNVGLRLEYLLSELKAGFSRSNLFLSPSATATYKLTTKQSIGITFRQTSSQPSLFNLIPTTYMDGYYTMGAGNPDIKSEIRYHLSITHNIRLGQSVVSSQIFAQKVDRAIGYLTTATPPLNLYTKPYNLGASSQFGIQLTGALRIGRSVSLNPYIKLFESFIAPYSWVAPYGISDKEKAGIESGLSAAVSIKNGWAVSLIYQYNSTRTDFQAETYSDALYFISLTKTIKDRLMVGVTSGLPLARSFTYNRSRVYGGNFQSYSDGVIKMSTIPILFKLSYQFSSGKKVSEQNREQEPFIQIPQKGF
jgi:hypothetical protein